MSVIDIESGKILKHPSSIHYQNEQKTNQLKLECDTKILHIQTIKPRKVQLVTTTL